MWNPDAAANWSLLFTPIFGTWLHMQNWRALGETERAESAKTWLMLSTLVLVGLGIGGALMPFSGISQWTWVADFVLLLSWYFGSARGQARWVRERYGKDYVRKGWLPPVLAALGLLIANSFVLSVLRAISFNMMRR